MVEENCFLMPLYFPHHWILQPCGGPFSSYKFCASKSWQYLWHQNKDWKRIACDNHARCGCTCLAGEEEPGPYSWLLNVVNKFQRGKQQLLWVIFRKRKKANGTIKYIVHKMENGKYIFQLPFHSVMSPTKLDLRPCCWKLNSSLCFGLGCLKQDCLY